MTTSGHALKIISVKDRKQKETQVEMNFKILAILLIFTITLAETLDPFKYIADLMLRTSIMNGERVMHRYQQRIFNSDYFENHPRAKFYYPKNFR